MNKYIILLMLLLFALSVPADELSDKQKQLQNVQSQIQKAQQKAQETETKKKRADSEIKRTASLKRIVEDNLRKLKKDETQKKDIFEKVSSQLDDVETRLRELDELQNACLEMLLRADRSYAPNHLKHRDQRLLAHVANRNDLQLLSMHGYKTVLAQERMLRESDLSQVLSEVREKTSESKSITKTLSSLQSESSKLSNEQKNLQAQITKLKKDASQLESLIARLTSKPATPGSTSSYQFTGKKIAWPVRGKIIRSFGQETRAYGTSVTSNGIDIATPEGTAVVAADDGEVVFADRYGGQGNLVIIDHKNGFFTVYAYNSSLSVSIGAKVKRGQTIARSGSTGSASEPSLHFELRKDGKSINPVPYLE